MPQAMAESKAGAGGRKAGAAWVEALLLLLLLLPPPPSTPVHFTQCRMAEMRVAKGSLLLGGRGGALAAMRVAKPCVSAARALASTLRGEAGR